MQLTFLSILAALATSGAATQNAASNTSQPPLLNITAIAAVDGVSVFQCWQIDTPVAIVPGLTTYSLPGFVNTTMFVGEHDYDRQAETIYSLGTILQGTTIFTLPTTGEEYRLSPGKNSMVLIMDPNHLSPTNHKLRVEGPFVLLMSVTEAPPSHTVLHDGPCAGQDEVNSGSAAGPVPQCAVSGRDLLEQE